MTAWKSIRLKAAVLAALMLVTALAASACHFDPSGGKMDGSVAVLYIRDGYTPQAAYLFTGSYTAWKSGIEIFGMDMDTVGDYQVILYPDSTLSSFDDSNLSKEKARTEAEHIEHLKQLSTDVYEHWNQQSLDGSLFHEASLSFPDHEIVLLESLHDGSIECFLYVLDQNKKMTANASFTIPDEGLHKHRLAVYDETVICVNDLKWFDLECSEVTAAVDPYAYSVSKDTVLGWLDASENNCGIIPQDTTIFLALSQRVGNVIYTFFYTESTIVSEDSNQPEKCRYFAEFTLGGDLLRLGRLDGFFPHKAEVISSESRFGHLFDVSF